jgi:diguanylate cyclase (GGDEF)-like protein
MAYHDELIGLANRRALIDHLTWRMAAADASPVAVLFIDVGRLKALNSFLGHAAGDRYLQELAARLSAAVGAGCLKFAQPGPWADALHPRCMPR